MNWPSEGPLLLPQIDQKIVSATPLSGKAAVVQQTDRGIEVQVDPPDRNDIATVIRLTVSGKAFDIPPAQVVSTDGSVSTNKRATK